MQGNAVRMSLNKPIYHMNLRLYHLTPAIAIIINKSSTIKTYYNDLHRTCNDYIHKLQRYYFIR